MENALLDCNVKSVLTQRLTWRIQQLRMSASEFMRRSAGGKPQDEIMSLRSLHAKSERPVKKREDHS